MKLAEWVWEGTLGREEQQAVYSRALLNKLDELKLTYRVVWDPGPGDEVRERVEAVKRWFVNDWQTLDNKIKSSIVEGVSVFLAMFDMPDVAKVFCPPAPEVPDDPQAIAIQARAAKRAGEEAREPNKEPEAAPTSIPSVEEERIAGPRHLPSLYELIERGKVLALNMPAGSNPALARAVGVMLKNAWLQALLMRPTKMKESPGVYFRPAVFICDEYQAFASVGEDDPSGDEKSFALTRQCRCIPICRHAIHFLATLRLGQLGGVAGASADAPHTDFPVSQRRRIRQDCQRNVRAGGEDQGILHDQRDLQAGRKSPRSQAAQGEAAAASALPSLSGSNARPCFTRETSRCSRTVKRSVCPMTGRSRLNRDGSTSSLTICPSIIPIGERRRRADYEGREWTGIPETVSTGIGKRPGRFRSQRDHD